MFFGDFYLLIVGNYHLMSHGVYRIFRVNSWSAQLMNSTYFYRNNRPKLGKFSRIILCGSGLIFRRDVRQNFSLRLIPCKIYIHVLMLISILDSINILDIIWILFFIWLRSEFNNFNSSLSLWWKQILFIWRWARV